MTVRHLLVAIALVACAAGLPQANVKRQIKELRESYDFIIVGGGTAGLTVADRLTEAFPDRTVLVVEYGTIQEGMPVYEPPGGPPAADRWVLPSLPIPALNNKSASVQVGQVVGGSSVINGQFFDRGSKHDYKAWKAVGSPEFDKDENKWDWDGISPFFRKSVTFQVPTQEEADSIGYTWDVAAYNGSGRIHSSYPPFQWPIQKIAWDAWVEAGLPTPKECANGDKIGVCWVPTSQDPITAKRSHAGVGHYLEVIDKRPNYDLLVKHKVTRVVYAGDNPKSGPPKVEIKSLADGAIKVATAKLEVIISAGALHTPHILQRSGIGYASFLETAGVKVVANLPGVGYNFHDHWAPKVGVELTKKVSPSPDDVLLNRTYGDEALALYSQRPAKGPYTLAMGNSAIYDSLPRITSSYSELANKVRQQIKDGPEGLLPPGTPPEVVAGYKSQLSLLADGMENPEQPILESPFLSSPSQYAFYLKPLSRGTVLLDPTDLDGEPIIDYRLAANPVDLDILATFVPYFRKYFDTPTMKAYGARETSPGVAVQNREDILGYLRNSTDIFLSIAHPCCTAAMMPKEKGGVVGTDLRVHGLAGLSVIDCSIMPMLPGSHTSSSAYAIGEKGADILIRRWS